MSAQLQPPEPVGRDPKTEREDAPDWIVDTRRMEQPRLETVIDCLDAADEGETMVVITRISPVPLYDHLDELGWAYEARRISPDEWHIRIDCGGNSAASGERLRRPRRKRLG